MHRRLRPVSHLLRYRVFWFLVDLDELPALSRRLRLFSFDRFNVFSLRQRDYGDGAGLRARVEHLLRAAGLGAEGAIHLLTMPRLLGYAFNPLNIYFCHRPDGVLHAVLYEVNNTFGARHTYLIEVKGAAARPGHIVQHCAKQMHVSPFLDLDMRYRFDIDPPRPDRDGLRVGIAASDLGGTVLTAVLDARRQPLTDLALLRTLVLFPFVTLKVIVAIHWEAMRLWLKGLRVRANPGPPAADVSIIKSGHAE
ncbi:MAG: DUF1365 domain-containing protein [Variovorax sp.]|nr:DUF1365 domain-containing protein [Variovorax sp.]